MNKKDVIRLAIVGLVAGFISLFITNIIFSVPKNRSSKVPAVQSIPTSMPDIKNDPSYQAFLNSNALDLTQPVQIGGSQNSTPFSGASQ